MEGATVAVPLVPPPPTTKLTGTEVLWLPTVMLSDPVYVAAPRPAGFANTLMVADPPALMELDPVLKLNQPLLFVVTESVPPDWLVTVTPVNCCAPLVGAEKFTGFGEMVRPGVLPPLTVRFTVMFNSVWLGLLESATETEHE